jgi:dCMP deaminase
MLYLPVIHRGYDQLLDRFAGQANVLVLGRDFADDYPVVRKEIRALAPERAAQFVRLAYPGSDVRVVEPADLPAAVQASTLIMPDEDLMRGIARRYRLAESADIKFERTFLRWDRSWSKAGKPPQYQGRVTTDQLAAAFSTAALGIGNRSSDWWRQVGAVVVRDGRVIAAAHNTHMPSDYSPYVSGDPRNNYRRGARADLSTALHAEASVIGKCASIGTALAGADIYVSTFPCPACARLIAAVGFGRCFFAGGYSTLDGDLILQSAGVETIFVILDDEGHQRQLSFDDLEGAQTLGFD